MKTTKTSRLARVLVTAMVICMLACFMLPTFAMAAPDVINEAKNGVVQVNLVYTDDDNNIQPLASGTGFLINDNTVVTNHHVVHLTAEEMDYVKATLGKTEAEIKSRLSVSITVTRDVTIPTSIQTESMEMDFAILRLSNALQGKTPLKIRDTAQPIRQADDVWGIGFPSISSAVQAYNTYTSADATITNGTVNKIGLGVNLSSFATTNFLQTSCNLDYGNSGGPMVDEYGFVVGVCQGSISDDVTGYYYAISIEQVTEVLDALGIIYEVGYPNGSNPEPTNPSTEPPTEAPTPAPTNAPTDAPTDPTLPPEPPVPTTMILVIAAVAVVIIVVVVVVLLAGGKKKTPPAPAPMTPPVPPRPVDNSGFAPVTPTYPVQGAGETTVLNGEAGATTVLSRNTVNGGTLVRRKTGETVVINTDQFVIGREKKSVNYCIADNSSISRTHVRLTVRGGVTYLTDLGAANGTFVNGVRVHQEIALKNGDKITLADEDLDYKN